ncbi:DUF7322 domain-containing protein [Halogeometricum limi]|uniref:DUF7322 domain-containing protein n=1 Tax=Halogeometricum limi TaxID=555875 RepID=A0A1I6GZD2_9EURY|nr:hypothetical protein [Halogeometricum limi]SFR47401.1 hypothetical protein SAMN04488124_1726 [Halogeometricum limi]
MSREFDDWPDEPDEENPEDRWGDPERDLVNVPAVELPSSEPTEVTDVDEELQRAFWATVVLVNVAVAGISLGAMLLYFRGQLLVGGGAMLVGALAFARAYYFYREFQKSNDGDSADEDGDRNDDSDDADSNDDSDDADSNDDSDEDDD